MRRGFGPLREDLSHWKAAVNPDAFGLRDILRFADVPATEWHRYTDAPQDFPECRTCRHAAASVESNGAQIECKAKMRDGRFPACTTMCHRQILRIQRGEDMDIPSEQVSAVMKAHIEQEERVAKNTASREEKSKPLPTRRRKVPPLRRASIPQPPTLAQPSLPSIEPPKPREGDAPKPKRKRTLKGREK